MDLDDVVRNVIIQQIEAMTSVSFTVTLLCGITELEEISLMLVFVSSNLRWALVDRSGNNGITV